MFASTLAYHSPGRLRLRDCRWRDPAELEALMRAMRTIDGVRRLEPNLKAGSLVVRYDPVRLPPSSLLAKLAPYLDGGKAPGVPPTDLAPRSADALALPSASAEANRIAKMGLLATTGLTVASLRFNRHLHVAAGWAGLALLAVHLLHHRKKMWR